MSRRIQWSRWWTDLFAMIFIHLFFLFWLIFIFSVLSVPQCCLGLLLYFRLYVVVVRHEIQYTWIHLIQKVKNLYKYSQRWFMMFAPARTAPIQHFRCSENYCSKEYTYTDDEIYNKNVYILYIYVYKIYFDMISTRIFTFVISFHPKSISFVQYFY